MRLAPILIVVAAVSLAAAPAASAYKIAPPGNSAVSQYVENVPGAEGNVPSLTIRPHSRPGAAGAAGAIAQSTQQALASHGTDGAQAAALANATAPSGVRGQNRRRRSGGPAAGGSATVRGTPVSGSVASPASAVLKAVTGSATHGLGALLPPILAASAIGAGLLAALRRRRAA